MCLAVLSARSSNAQANEIFKKGIFFYFFKSCGKPLPRDGEATPRGPSFRGEKSSLGLAGLGGLAGVEDGLAHGLARGLSGLFLLGLEGNRRRGRVGAMFFFPPLTSLASSLFITLKGKKNSLIPRRRRGSGGGAPGTRWRATPRRRSRARARARGRGRRSVVSGSLVWGGGGGWGGVEKRLKKKRRKKSATFRATAATTERADADGRTRRVVEAAVGGCGFPASFPPFFGISRCTAFRKARSCWFIAQEPGRKVAPVLGSTT